MSGKILMLLLVGVAVAMGGSLWYVQNYAYYETIETIEYPIALTLYGTEETQEIPAQDFTILDADSSPLKFRACFKVINSVPMMTETYVVYDDPTPLAPPAWFGCFDHVKLTEDLNSGVALAFLGQENFETGVDRVIAVYDDGRAFAWHQLNDQFAE